MELNEDTWEGVVADRSLVLREISAACKLRGFYQRAWILGPPSGDAAQPAGL